MPSSFNSIRNMGGAQFTSGIDHSGKTSTERSHGNGIKHVGSQLQRGMRNLVSCFKPQNLSAKVHDFDTETVHHAKEFAAGEIKNKENELRKKSNFLGKTGHFIKQSYNIISGQEKKEQWAKEREESWRPQQRPYRNETTTAASPRYAEESWRPQQRPYRNETPAAASPRYAEESWRPQQRPYRNETPAAASPRYAEHRINNTVPSWNSSMEERANKLKRDMHNIDSYLHGNYNLDNDEATSLLRQHREARDELNKLEKLKPGNNLHRMGKESEVDRIKADINKLGRDLSKNRNALEEAQRQFGYRGYEDDEKGSYQKKIDSESRKLRDVEEKLGKKKSELQALIKTEGSGKPAAGEWNVNKIPSPELRREARELEKIVNGFASLYGTVEEIADARLEAIQRLDEIAAEHGMTR